MNKISATIVADSVNQQGDRLTSLLITFPRILLSEINTHRMLSKNTSSSRAIPFKKMVEAVQNDPFVPVAWQKHHSGMQGSEYITDETEIENCKSLWLVARNHATDDARRLHDVSNITKQLCNRLLEPFMWTTMLITGSKEGWDNFFNLRLPEYYLENIPIVNEDLFFSSLSSKTITLIGKSKKELLKEINQIDNDPYNDFKTIINNYSDLDWLKLNKGQAEIHMMALAEKIYDAVNESTPKQLESGQWHIPFEDKINVNDVKEIIINNLKLQGEDYGELEISKWYNEVQHEKVKISVAMAARTSYTIVGEEKGLDYEAMIGLHDRLLAQDPPHSSPLEHCARAMNEEEYYSYLKTNGEVLDYTIDGENIYSQRSFGWCGPYKGFISYRHIIETQNE